MLNRPLARLWSWPVPWAVATYVFATSIYTAARRSLADPDVWWVAAAGREMLRTHAAPTQNLFSFTDPSVPWVMHEWLLGPLYAGAVSWLGPSAFNLLAVANCAAGFGLIALGTVGRARHPAAGFFVAFLAVAFFGEHFFVSARPTHVAMLFPLAVTLVAFAPTFGWASVVVSVVLELVWANAHGSFPMGVVLLAGAALGAERDRRRRVLAVALGALVTVLNPYGLGLHRLVWHYFRGDEAINKSIAATIAEYGSLVHAYRAGDLAPAGFYAFFLVAFGALAAATLRRHRVRALVSLFFLGLALLHARHLYVAGLVTILLLVPAADDAVERLRLKLPEPHLSRNALCGILVVPVWILGFATYAWTRHVRDPIEWVSEGPPLFRQIAALPDGAHVLLPFERSSIAIWLAADRGVRVYMDSRNDCYRASTFDTFIDLTLGEVKPDEARRELARSGTDALILPTNHRLVDDVRQDPSWHAVRTEGRWSLYRRDLSAPVDSR